MKNHRSKLLEEFLLTKLHLATIIFIACDIKWNARCFADILYDFGLQHLLFFAVSNDDDTLCLETAVLRPHTELRQIPAGNLSSTVVSLKVADTNISQLTEPVRIRWEIVSSKKSTFTTNVRLHLLYMCVWIDWGLHTGFDLWSFRFSLPNCVRKFNRINVLDKPMEWGD